MALLINDNINSSKTNLVNIDAKYGPYSSVENAISQLFSDNENLYVTNGYTFGVIENGTVVEYALHGITQSTTSSEIRSNYVSYVERKVNDTKVILRDSDGNTIGQFTLNQVENGDIVITIPAQITVDQAYDASSTNPQSGTAVASALASYIQKVTGHTSEIPTFSADGTLQSSGKTMANAVFFEDVN